MSESLPFYFRIDYRSTLKNGRVNQRCRIHAHDIPNWEDLIASIMRGDAIDPDTDELLLFDKIIKIEKVNKSAKIGG